jgi:formylglycine-generating enzyme required for sulfatase activity
MIATRRIRRATAIVGLVLSVGSAGGCQSEPPPLGEVLVVADTDVPLTFVNRVRVDVYGSDGTWRTTNDFPLLSATDWPMSFSLVSPSASGPPEPLLVRLRAYRDSKTRPYLGERFEAREKFVPPTIATSLESMCAAETALPQHTVKRVRIGATKITSSKTCPFASQSGAASVRIEVKEDGDYDFEVPSYRPRVGSDVKLVLRRTCADESTEISCNDDRTPADDRPLLSAHLASGTYSLVVAGVIETKDSTDVDLVWGRHGSKAPPPPITERRPLLVDDAGVDTTPSDEPLPGVTIDRLVAVSLIPGARATIRVPLAGACAGTMARLGEDPQVPSLEGAMSCVDAETAWTPVLLDALPRTDGIVRDRVPAERTFGQVEPCAAEPPSSDRVCVPGGPLVLDDNRFAGLRSGVPRSERLAEVDSFFLDRTEVSVGAWRAALAHGFVPPLGAYENEGPLAQSSAVPNFDTNTLCTFSKSDRGREKYPLSCVDWRTARAYCRFKHGDLPTEAQWMYAAAVAGSPERRRFPWGDTRPTCPTQVSPTPTNELRACCMQAVFARADRSEQVGVGGNVCSPYGIGPQPIDPKSKDVTPLGIIGLAGGLQEWTRDASAAGDDPCFTAESIKNPVCDDDTAPTHTALGDAFYGPEDQLLNGSARDDFAGGVQAFGVGFRCAYPSGSP